MNDIVDFLLNQVGEMNLVQHILTMGAPVMKDELKRDIGTFFFTWETLIKQHVPVAVNIMEVHMVTWPPHTCVVNARWVIYRELLKDVDDFITEHKMERDPVGRLYGIRKGREHRKGTKLDYRIYWQHFVLSSWSPHKSFFLLTGSLRTNEMHNLIMKFLLRFTPIARLRFIHKLGLIGGRGN